MPRIFLSVECAIRQTVAKGNTQPPTDYKLAELNP